MGWAVGYDEKWQRDIGYGVPALCDYPGCNEEIDRGLSYVCGYEKPYGGDDGCGLFFCGEHGGGMICERCDGGEDPFEAKPDIKKWTEWKATDPSWAEWRKEQEKAGVRGCTNERG
jgi:hypothetical protein